MGFPPVLAFVTLDGKVRVRRAFDAGNRGRNLMRDNKDKPHRNRIGRGVANAAADSPVYTARR